MKNFFFEDQSISGEGKRKLKLKKWVKDLLICFATILGLYICIIVCSIIEYQNNRMVFDSPSELVATNYTPEYPVKSFRATVVNSTISYKIIFEFNNNLSCWDATKEQITTDFKEVPPVVFTIEYVYHFNRQIKQREPNWWEWWLIKFFRPIEAINQVMEYKNASFIYKGPENIIVFY